MIRLRHLKLQNFRSFYGKHDDISFPESGLLLVRGSSLDHGDSSGSGKSSIILAVAYALGVCNQPATELQSWGATEPMQVELELTKNIAGDDAPIVICRGKKNSLEIAGQKITGAKAIDAALQKELGLSSEILKAISFRDQNTRGSFLAMTDAEKKDFLTGLLGLDQIEAALLASETALKEHQRNIPVMQAQLDAVSKHVWPEPGEPLPMDGLDKEYDDIIGWIAELQRALAAPEPEFVPNPRIEELQKMKEMAQRGWVQEKAAVDATAREVTKRRDLATKARMGWERDYAGWTKRAADLREQVRAMREGTCPTCEQAWHDETALENACLSLDSAEKMLVKLGDGTQWDADLNATAPYSSERLEALERARQEFDAAIVELRVEDQRLRPASEKPTLQKQLQVACQTRDRIKADIDQRKQFNAGIDKARATMERNRAEDARILETYRKVLAETEQKAAAELDFQQSLGRKGFLGVIFGDILQEIKTEANQRLGQLANVSQVTLDLVTETETQAGTAKKAITPIFYVNGHETKFNSLSGGMQTSVDLIVDLAMMTVIQRRTGAMPGFLFLDEAFNGQGVITKEASLEALRAYSAEKLIVVIDHSSETKEFFSSWISVENSGGRSRVTSLE